jgi:hypothetical protein
MTDRNQVIMYGQSPSWVGDDPVVPEISPNPFLPNTSVDMTTLTRLYNLEQEVNRLKVDLDELRKTLATVNAKVDAAPEVVANAVVLAFDKTREKKKPKKARKDKKK